MPTIVKPALTEGTLGTEAWHALLEEAVLRRRSPKDQAISLILFALYRRACGDDVEPNPLQLNSSLRGDGVAA